MSVTCACVCCEYRRRIDIEYFWKCSHVGGFKAIQIQLKQFVTEKTLGHKYDRIDKGDTTAPMWELQRRGKEVWCRTNGEQGDGDSGNNVFVYGTNVFHRRQTKTGLVLFCKGGGCLF